MKFLLSSLSDVYCFTENIFPSQERKLSHCFCSPSIGIPPSSHPSTRILLSHLRRAALNSASLLELRGIDMMLFVCLSGPRTIKPERLVSPNVSHRVLTLLQLKNTDDACETSIPLMARFPAGRADKCRTLLRRVMRSFVLVMDVQNSFTYRRSHTRKRESNL